MRGAYLGEGFVKGIGQVRIFYDLDFTDKLVVEPVKYDATPTSVRRDRVSWRKTKKRTDDGNPGHPRETSDTQVTLFD